MLRHIGSAAAQAAILFVLMGAGCVSAKARWMNGNGAEQMTRLVHFIATPCVIIHSFLTADFNAGMLRGMGFTALFAAAAHLLGISLSALLFRGEERNRRNVYSMCVTFSNCGFMGVPLVSGVLGAGSVVYISVYIAVFNLFTWTYGTALYRPDQKASPLKMAVNPGTVSIALGLAAAAAQWRPPLLVTQPVSMFANLNSPLAMIVLGYYLASSSLRPAPGEGRMWLAAALRLVAVPAAALGAAAAFRLSGVWVQTALALTAMPCAVNVLLFTARFGGDTGLAARTAAYCTLLSMVSMPLLLAAVLAR